MSYLGCRVWLSPDWQAVLNGHALPEAPPSAASSSVAAAALQAGGTPKHTSTQQNSECSKCFHTRELISIENRLSQGIRGQQQLFCPGDLMHLGTQGQMGTYTPRCVLAGDSDREVAGRKQSGKTAGRMAFGKLQEGK